jgi:hypothetical protein
MRTKIYVFCGSLILFLGACAVSGAEQVKQPADSNLPARVPGKAVGRAVEVNTPAGAVQQVQIEQARQHARDRIRQRSTQRRAKFAAQAEANEPNAPRRLRIPANPQGPENEVNSTARLHQQMTAIDQQLTYEKDKHLDRIARLNRIRELAQQQGDNEAVARTDTLIEKEKQLYQMKTQRMEMRKERVNRFLEKGPPPTDANRPSRPPSPVKRGERAPRTWPAETQKKPGLVKSAKDANQPPDQNK